MEMLEKNDGKIAFSVVSNASLANALRRSVWEIPTLAIHEVEIFKNDSALYDEMISHRLGLVPLKNQKLGKDKFVEMKMKFKSKDSGEEVLAGELGPEVVYPEIPVVLVNKGQEIELIARAKQGIGLEHSKHIPGLLYYKYDKDIKISGEGEKQSELAELYPKTVEFDGKLKVKSTWKDDLDVDDLKEFPGVDVKEREDIVFVIESYGLLKPEEIFKESLSVLKKNLAEVSKALK
jgi:DNA-directed RNA polymerase subunit D